MNNPLFGGMQQASGMLGNMQQIIQQFNRFKQTFQGDPRQQLQQLLNSGRVSQQAYNNAYQQAQQLQRIIDGK